MEKTPILVITSAKWSSDLHVMFDNEDVMDFIPDDWIDSRYDQLLGDLDRSCEKCDITRDDIKNDMKSDFYDDNTDVEEYWPEHGILVTVDGEYYRYYNHGGCTYISDNDAMQAMTDIRDKKINEWKTEQQQIANSEIVTPRDAGVMERFGIDDSECSELADDKTILRRYNGKLFVFESQIDEPAQWRLLQPRPHMPTGTLPRPIGV